MVNLNNRTKPTDRKSLVRFEKFTEAMSKNDTMLTVALDSDSITIQRAAAQW